MTSSPVLAPRGLQRPRLLAVPPAASTDRARDAIDLAWYAGLELDPWQEFALECMLGVRPDGRWSAYEVGLCVARQNGKGGVLEARELAGLYLFDDRTIIHSAHRIDTSLEAFLRLLDLIESTPKLSRQIRRVIKSHGQEGIELKSGARIKFRTRSSAGGRGFSGDLVVLDEAMYISTGMHGALLPTLSARRNPQVLYVGSAVDAQEHEHGHVFAAIRRRGVAGGDPLLCYLEWSPDITMAQVEAGQVDAQLDDPAVWAFGNPAQGIRIREELIAAERRSMTRRTFAIERCNIGDWPQPEADDEHIIDLGVWKALADRASQPCDPVAFAVDMTPDRARAAIAIAGLRADGRWHGEVIEDVTFGELDLLGKVEAGRRIDSEWVLDRIAGLVRKWDPCAVVLDPAGAAASLLPGLDKRGIEPVTTTARQMAQACGAFYDDVTQDRFRHLGQKALEDSVAAAGKRDLGGAWAWDRRGKSPIHTLVALTLARHGVAAHGTPKPPPAEPQAVPATGDTTTHTADLAHTGF